MKRKLFYRHIPANKWGKNKNLEEHHSATPNKLMDVGNNFQWQLVLQKEEKK